MKPSAKPISSPGRGEKFPPPLMRFLRSNVGSKSRGRSRSSPMFTRKKNNRNSAIETQEPSSPKVTCIGQVRVRRSSARRRRPRPGAPTRRRCCWIRAALCFHCFPRKIRPHFPLKIWQTWVSCFQVGFRAKSKPRKNNEAQFVRETENFEPEIHEEEDDEEVAKVFVSSCSSPPKNALLLTRCRSAPYRSTSLASRFWGSPLRTEANQEQKEEHRRSSENGGKMADIEKPTSQRVSVSEQEPRRGSEFEEDEEFLKRVEECIRERVVKSANIEGSKEELLGNSSRPLILTRCKSEPARTAEKLNPDVGFWKKRRLGIPDSCLSSNI